MPPEPTAPPLAYLNFTSLQMHSADQGWAVAGSVVAEYKKGSWTRQAASVSTDFSRPQPDFADIAMLSADEGWAVGRDPASASLGNEAAVAHFSGGKWTAVPLDPAVYNLRAISMTSPNEGWIVGGVFAGGVHFCSLLHYDGTTWQKQDCPLENPVYAVQMLDANEGWAVGMSGGIMQYHEGKWQKVMGGCVGEIEDICHAPNMALTQGTLYSVYMTSPTEGWAVGDEPTNNVSNGVILQYRSGQWQRVPGPPDTVLYSIYMTSAAEGWAVGQHLGQANQAIILHYADGQWREAVSPKVAALHRVYMVSPTEGWAVGEQSTILHYQNGSWIEYLHLE